MAVIGLRSLERAARGLARRAVRHALRGYRVDLVRPDPSRPTALGGRRSVLVVGGGLAGITAAETLGRSGFAVTLRERQPTLGGKIGGEMGVDADGRAAWIDHGFHAFFRHYDNLAGLLARAGVAPMKAIDDYVVIGADGHSMRFGDVDPTPLLNVVDLASRGVFRLGEVSAHRTRTRMHELLQYDADRTFRDLDDVSFADYADQAGLPPKLRRLFATFGRAFFAEDHRLSAAELVRAFHFYYLGHDGGLIYDYPTADARTALVEPLERLLLTHGVRIETGRPCDRIEVDGDAVRVDGQRYDALVLATPAVATRVLVESSPSLAAALPRTLPRLRRLDRSARYAVLRLWLDRDPCATAPVFVSTDRVRLLDAVARVHAVTPDAARWSARTGGAVLELHSYAVPEDVADGDVASLLVDELGAFFPDARAAGIQHTHLLLRDDFTARHVGLAAHRPSTETEHSAVLLAGDWVALPTPALLMEGACVSGLLAANVLLDREGLSPERVTSVPLRGVFAKERWRAQAGR